TFAALTTKRSINASLDVNRLNNAVSTFNQFDLIMFEVIISEFTLRKSAYTASIDIVFTSFTNADWADIVLINALFTFICVTSRELAFTCLPFITSAVNMPVLNLPIFASIASKDLA